MAFKGRINIREIEKKAVDLDGTQAEPWIQSVLERAAPDTGLTGLQPPEWAARSQFSTQLHLETAGSDFEVRGSLKAQVPTTCSRCADSYPVDRAADFRLIVHRLTKEESDMAKEDSGDPDYLFLAKDEIDLVQILAEQLVVQEPVAECPARQADGSCTLCGKNPQFAGQGAETSADSPFAKLKSLKLED